MTAALLVAGWVLGSPGLAWLIGSGIRLGDAGGPQQLPARLSPRAQLPSPERVLLFVGVLAGLVIAFATRGQVVTWDGVVAVQP